MISLRSVLLSALLPVASCAATMAEGGAEGWPALAKDETTSASLPVAEGGAEGWPALAKDETTSAIPKAGNAAELVRCQSACRQGLEAMETFCRSCPEPRAKVFCWAAAKAGLVACPGFCYNWWGS